MTAFRAVVEADVLQQFVDTADALVEETRLHIDDKAGMSLTCIDAATVGMVQAELAPPAFESFDFDGDGELTIGVLVDAGDGRVALKDILGLASSGDLIELEYLPTEGKLRARVGEATLYVSLIPPEDMRQEPDMDMDQEWAANITYGEDDLAAALSATTLVSDHVDLETDTDGSVRFIAEGDTDDSIVEYDRDTLGDGSEIDDDARAIFSVQYLESVSSVIPSDTTVRHEIGEEFPTRIKYGFAEGKGRAEFMIAPRIEQ